MLFEHDSTAAYTATPGTGSGASVSFGGQPLSRAIFRLPCRSNGYPAVRASIEDQMDFCIKIIPDFCGRCQEYSY
jgi:hypothetical protein